MQKRLLLMSVLASVSCDTVAEPNIVVSDSSGVAIVESFRPEWETDSSWSLGTTPTVSVGEALSSPGYELYRVAGATRLSTGIIVIANGGTSELRFYSEDGKFLQSVGRPGSGPGEFQRMMRLYRFAADSLLLFDSGLYRFSVFDSQGRFIRTFTPPQDETGLAYPVAGNSALGVVLAVGRPMSSDNPGLQRDSAHLLLVSTSGQLRANLGRYPVTETVVRFTGGTRITLARPFARETKAALVGRDLFITTADSYQFEVLDSIGRRVRIIRVRRPNERVTQDDIDRFRKLSPQARRGFDGVTFPETYPSVRALHADDSGYLWVEDYQRPGIESPLWNVHSAAGHWLGEIRGPKGFRLFEIGRDYVLGLEMDPSGVERVRLYPLNR